MPATLLVLLQGPEDSLDDVAMAIRLYGQPEKWGISVELALSNVKNQIPL